MIHTFTTESVYLTLNSLWGRESVERLKQSSDTASFTFFSFLFLIIYAVIDEDEDDN